MLDSTSTREKLKQFIERIERLEEEKSQLSQEISDIYKEAKDFGLDPKIMRKVVSLRKKDPEQFQEEQELLETYQHALGMLPEMEG